MVPLAEVLDEESGIGFETAKGPGAEGSPLLAGLAFGGGTPENRVRWGASEQHMLGGCAALAAGAAEIVLDDADIEAMKVATPAPLPDAFAVMLRLAGDTILFEGIERPVGRAAARPVLPRVARDRRDGPQAPRAEEALRPDAVFAEIVHLNEGRIGNILCRPVLRAHEIVYLGVSGAPADHQIHIDDLVVGVRGGRIVLWSRRLDSEVVPRLTTAHNFRLRSLAVYRFLCALAGQGIDPSAGRGARSAARRFCRASGSAARCSCARAGTSPSATSSRSPRPCARRRSSPRSAASRGGGRGAARGAQAAAHVRARDGGQRAADRSRQPAARDAFADEISGSNRSSSPSCFRRRDRLVVARPRGRVHERGRRDVHAHAAEAPGVAGRLRLAASVRRDFRPARSGCTRRSTAASRPPIACCAKRSRRWCARRSPPATPPMVLHPLRRSRESPARAVSRRARAPARARAAGARPRAAAARRRRRRPQARARHLHARDRALRRRPRHRARRGAVLARQRGGARRRRAARRRRRRGRALEARLRGIDSLLDAVGLRPRPGRRSSPTARRCSAASSGCRRDVGAGRRQVHAGARRPRARCSSATPRATPRTTTSPRSRCSRSATRPSPPSAPSSAAATPPASSCRGSRTSRGAWPTCTRTASSTPRNARRRWCSTTSFAGCTRRRRRVARLPRVRTERHGQKGQLKAECRSQSP